MATKRVPTQEIRFIVDQYHVGTPDEVIAEDISRRAMKAGFLPYLIRRCVEVAIRHHRHNQKMYRWVMGGMY